MKLTKAKLDLLIRVMTVHEKRLVNRSRAVAAKEVELSRQLLKEMRERRYGNGKDR